MASKSIRQIYFYLTEGCNLACRHCWLNPPYDPDMNRYTNLPLSTFELILKEALPMGLQSIKLTGGEPLIHPEILELLSICKNNYLPVTIETNGYFCSDAIIQSLLQLPGCFISVSLDSATREFHDAFRGRSGAFENSKATIKALAEAGLAPQMIMSLMPENIHQLADYVTLAESLGAGSIKINVIQPTSRGEELHDKNKVISVPEILLLSKKINSEIQPSTHIMVYLDIPMAFRSISDIKNGFAGRCGIKEIIGVLPKGQYALCGIGSHIPDLVFGEAGKDRLKEIWENNPLLFSIRDELPGRLEGICQICCMKQLCLSSCIAQNFYRNKTLWGSYWFCEIADRLGLFPESRKIPSHQKNKKTVPTPT